MIQTVISIIALPLMGSIPGFVIIALGYIQIIPLSIRRLRDCGIIKNKITDLFFYFLLIFSSLNLPKGDSLLESIVKIIVGFALLMMFIQPSNYFLEVNNTGGKSDK